MKKFAVMLCLILTIFFLVGCTKQADVLATDSISADGLVKQNANGSVDVFYSIDLDFSNLIKNNDITQNDVNELRAKIQTNATEIIAKCKANYNFNLNKSYNQGIITKEQRNILSKQFNVYTGGDNNSFLVKLSFASADAYNVYLNRLVDSPAIVNTTNGLFVNKHSQKGVNPLGKVKDVFDSKSAFKYFNDFKNEYLNSHFSADIVAKFPKLTMTYSYITTSSKLHSDADQTSLTTYGYLHTWQLNEKNYTKQIEFYTLSANPAVWYLLALTVSFIFIDVYLIVIYLKKRKIKINSGFDI